MAAYEVVIRGKTISATASYHDWMEGFLPYLVGYALYTMRDRLADKVYAVVGGDTDRMYTTDAGYDPVTIRLTKPQFDWLQRLNDTTIGQDIVSIHTEER